MLIPPPLPFPHVPDLATNNNLLAIIVEDYLYYLSLSLVSRMLTKGESARQSLANCFLDLRNKLRSGGSNPRLNQGQLSDVQSLMGEIEALELSIRMLNKWGDLTDMHDILSWLEHACREPIAEYDQLEEILKGSRLTICIRALYPIM